MILLLTPEESFVPFLQGLVGNGVEISRKWDPGWRDAQPIDVVQSTIHPLPDIVIIGPTVPEAVALEWAGAFDREQPEVGRLIIAPATPDLLMGAMRLGVREVVPPTRQPTRSAKPSTACSVLRPVCARRARSTRSRIRPTG